jgi:hypothetical protein
MIRLLMLAAGLGLALAQNAIATEQEGFALFSEDEAMQLRLDDEEWRSVPITRSISLGPSITIQAPNVSTQKGGATIEAPTPADLWVLFEDKKAPVDMTSLRIKIKKGFLSKSLTDRLQPFIQGNSLRGEKLEIPRGRYSVEFSIADTDGSRTVETYRLLVGEG